MKIYLAGTPGTEEREGMAEENFFPSVILLGYSATSIWSLFSIFINQKQK